MKTRFGFDHTFTTLPNLDAYFRLGERGFTLVERAVEHPPSYHCRFIMFEAPEMNPNARPFRYLEFAWIQSMEKMRAESQKPGEPPPTDSDLLMPGISLNADRDLESAAEVIQRTHTDLKPTFEHRNYNWAENSVTREPGWNFLNFGNPPVPGVYLWVTQYDPRNEQTQPNLHHANTARRILGCVWNAPREHLETVAGLTAAKLEKDHLLLHDGTMIWFGENLCAPLARFPCEYPYKAVVLKCDSLDTFITTSKSEAVIDWNGRQAAVVQVIENRWVILAIEDDRF